MDPLYVYYSQVNANDKGEERRGVVWLQRKKTCYAHAEVECSVTPVPDFPCNHETTPTTANLDCGAAHS